MKRLYSYGVISSLLFVVCAGLSQWHPFRYSERSIQGYAWDTIQSLVHSVNLQLGQMPHPEGYYEGGKRQTEIEGRQNGKDSMRLVLSLPIFHL